MASLLMGLLMRSLELQEVAVRHVGELGCALSDLRCCSELTSAVQAGASSASSSLHKCCADAGAEEC